MKLAEMAKTVKVSGRPIDQLLLAKKESDRKNYKVKHMILYQLMQRHPEDFTIEVDNHGITGLTHIPTGFRIHTVTEAVPSELRKSAVSMPVGLGLGALGLGAAALGAGYGNWWLNEAPSKLGPDISNLDYWKTRLSLALANVRLRLGEKGNLWAIDTPMRTGLHRVTIPRWAVDETVLNRLPDWRRTYLAIPERGQVDLPSWRQHYTGSHLHKHPHVWTMHKDRYESATMKLERAKDLQEALDYAEEGSKHLLEEGVPGTAELIRSYLENAPYIPDSTQSMKDRLMNLLGREKTGSSLPLRHGNTVIPAKIGSTDFTLELAETDRNARLGMMYFEAMPDDYGMMFKSAESFWMPNVNFDLDLAFIRADGTVTEVQTMRKLAAGEAPVNYQPSVPGSAHAIEFQAGWCLRNEVRPGVKVTVGHRE